MSFLAIGKNIITQATKIAKITDPIHGQVTQNVFDGIQNSTKLLKEKFPDEFSIIQKFLNSVERYGISSGELKFIQQYEILRNLEVFADENLLKALLKRQNLLEDGIAGFVTKENKKAFIKLLRDKKLSDEELKPILHLITEENAPILKQLLKDKNFDKRILSDLPVTHFKTDNVDVLKAISAKGNIDTQEMLYIMAHTNKSNSNIAVKLLERADKNTKGLNLILDKIYAYDGIGEEALETFQLRKKFFTELLDNPNFKLGKDEMENFSISQVLATIKPENYDIAQDLLLNRNIGLAQISDFLKGITQENQQIAKRILTFAQKDTKLPDIQFMTPETATKYLDEVAKINNPKAQSLYVEAMENLDEQRIEEVLNVIRTTKPENAQRASAIIAALNLSSKSLEDIDAMVRLFEQNNRQLNGSLISSLTVFSEIKEVPVAQFIEKIIKNKAIPDENLYYLTNKYLRIADEINVEKFSDILEILTQNKNLKPEQVKNIFSQISMDNIDVVEKYALNPNITKIDFATLNPKYADELERLFEIDIPAFSKNKLLKVLKSSGKGGEKRLEVLKNLLKREEKPNIEAIAKAVSNVDELTLPYVDDILARQDLTLEQVLFALKHIQLDDNVEGILKMLKDESLNGKYFRQLYTKEAFKIYEQHPELAKKALELNVPLQVMISKGGYNRCYAPITDVIEEKILAKMLNGIEQAKKDYGILAEDLYLQDFDDANDLFIVLKQEKNNLKYKFNKRTGALETITQGEKSINLSKGTQVTDSVYSETKIKFDDEDVETPYMINTITKDKNGEYRTLYSESAIEGQYDIFHTKADGSRIRVGHAQITPNGAKHVRRTLTSLDGSKTYTAYREDKLGNSFFHSVISDNTGKQISEVKRTFKVLSKNHFVSTVNEQSYDIVFTDKKVVVTKLDSLGKKTPKKIEYTISDIAVDTADEILGKLSVMADDDAYHQAVSIFKKYGIAPKTIDRSCVDMLKRLPGDEWFAMDKSCDFVMLQNFDPDNACYAGNSIFMSKELRDNLGVFAHELGHAKFHILDLKNDKELMKIYNSEKRRYTSNFPESRISSIDYFLEGNKANKNGLNEACAETNLMTDTIQTWDVIQDRTIFLEQYFPKTVAYIRGRYSALL